MFVFRSHLGTFSLDPESGAIQSLAGELQWMYPPYLYDAVRDALIGRCYDQAAHKWTPRALSFTTGERLMTYVSEPLQHPWSLCFSPDGKLLIVAFCDLITNQDLIPGITLFDRQTGELVNRFKSWGDRTSGVTFTSDGLLVHGQQFIDGEKLPCPVYHEIVHRSLQTGEAVKTIRLPDSFYQYFWLRMTTCQRLLAINHDFMVCEIHDDGSVTHPFGPRRVAEWNSMELLGDDRLLLGTGAGSLHLINIETGEQIWTTRHRRGGCSTLAVSADHKWLLTGVEGPTRLWRLPH